MLGPGTGVIVAPALGPGVPSGVAVGNGAARRQIGRFIFGVGVGVASVGCGVGVRFGGGGSVGGGTGGTRGSGKPGSVAAVITSVRFQLGPYGDALFCTGAGVTVTGAMLSRRFSVTCPMTRSPARSPSAIAAMSTAIPSARTMVIKRFDGSDTEA